MIFLLIHFEGGRNETFFIAIVPPQGPLIFVCIFCEHFFVSIFCIFFLSFLFSFVKCNWEKKCQVKKNFSSEKKGKNIVL